MISKALETEPDRLTHSVKFSPDNPALSELALSWPEAKFSAEDGIGSLRSLHEAGDAIVAVAMVDDEGTTILGSGVMVGPGLIVTATHVLDEFREQGKIPIFMTFLPDGSRAWFPLDFAALEWRSAFGADRRVVSDVSLVSCTLNSEARPEHPLTLAPIRIALPLIGERLWTIGFRHHSIEGEAALITPMISSGRVTAAFHEGRGERMPSPCFEVDMDTIGGMSGGPVLNADGHVVGILSSSFEGGPSYVTLLWEALRLHVKGAIPKLQAKTTVSLLGARAKGVVKIKGNVSRNPWGDLALKLSEEEGGAFAADAGSSWYLKTGLKADELENFLDAWGSKLEEVGCKAAIAALGSLSLPRMRNYLSATDIPDHCLEAITSFSVEDWDGVEDLELKSAEGTSAGHIRIEFLVRLQAYVWVMSVPMDAFHRHETDFRTHFINIGQHGPAMSLERIQRGFFKVEAVFNSEAEAFFDVVVTSSAIQPDR